MIGNNEGSKHEVDGLWLRVTNQRTVSLQLLIEPWGVGSQMLPQTTFYVYVTKGEHPPEVIYQDDFVIIHQSLVLLDDNGSELYNFTDIKIASPTKKSLF